MLCRRGGGDGGAHSAVTTLLALRAAQFCNVLFNQLLFGCSQQKEKMENWKICVFSIPFIYAALFMHFGFW